MFGSGYPLSRAMAFLTLGYGVYCLARPDHLAEALDEPPTTARRRMALTYGARDIPVSALAIAGPPAVVPITAALRVCFDVADGAILAATTTDSARAKSLGATVGWATVNLVAFGIDSRRERSTG